MAERKGLTFFSMIEEAKGGLRDLFIDRPRAWVTTARERLKNLPKTNFDLGVMFAAQGKWMDALFRFRVAAYFQPEYPQVWYNIGCCYFRTGKPRQAEAALQKALRQNPQDQEAIFMLAAINPAALPPGQRPERMPRNMVQDFFSGIAATYDVDEARSRYQAGKIIHDLASPYVRNPNPAVLDLACGSGIAARPWRAAAKEIIGVDLTKAMLELADKATHAEKKLYDKVIEADAAQLPEGVSASAFDLVLLVNAAQFIGDLAGAMQSAAKAMNDTGVFVLTVEPHSAPAGFGVGAQSGRFSHSAAYVRQVAGSAKLRILKESNVALYVDGNAQAFVFAKDNA